MLPPLSLNLAWWAWQTICGLLCLEVIPIGCLLNWALLISQKDSRRGILSELQAYNAQELLGGFGQVSPEDRTPQGVAGAEGECPGKPPAMQNQIHILHGPWPSPARASLQERPRCRRIAAEPCVAAGAESRAVQNVGASKARGPRGFKARLPTMPAQFACSSTAFQGAPEHCPVQTEGHIGQQLP